jgi:urocanate hydratase
VYGGTGKAARNWECFDTIVATLKRLEGNQTMLVQSGKAVGVFETHEDAPRVLIANAMLVPAWATGEEFRRLEGLGLTMYGQMTAGSWIYIGSQGIVQGTFETFAEAARRHFGGDLSGRLVVTAGLGGMGGAQPLAATMNGAVALVAEVDPDRIEKRLRTRYLDESETDADRAIDRALSARDARRSVSIGVRCNAVELLERLLARGVVPDLATDQTSAHDELNGYVPRGDYAAVLRLRREDPAAYIARSYATMAEHMRGLLELQRRGAVVFDYGNNLRGQAQKAGVGNAFEVGGFVPLYIRPLFCEGKGPFRWAPSSSSSRRTRPCGAGSRSRRSASPSRGCRPASAGSATASGTGRASSSTTSCGRAASARRSSSAAITSMPVPSPRRTARPRGCATAPMRSPTGRS